MIIVNLDVMMARRKMSLNELSERVGITIANLSPSVSRRSTPSAAPWTAPLATFSSIATTNAFISSLL